MHDEQSLYCPSCAEVVAVEVPPCPDGHGADCPDRACLPCGMGLTIGPGAPILPRRAATRRAA